MLLKKATDVRMILLFFRSGVPQRSQHRCQDNTTVNAELNMYALNNTVRQIPRLQYLGVFTKSSDQVKIDCRERVMKY